MAQALPAQFTTLTDFFDNILEDFIQLPICMFKTLTSTMRIPDHLQLAFNSNLLLPLISGSVPDYLHTEPTQDHFERKLFPLTSTSLNFSANAKISLIIERLFMYMISKKALTPTIALRQSMETGIEARHKVTHNAKRRKRNAEEDAQAQELMAASSERLLGLLEVLKISAGKVPQQWERTDKLAPGSVFLSFSTGSPLSSAPDSDTE